MRLRPHRAGLAAALLSTMLALTLAGCAPPVRERAPAAAPPADFPEAYYLEAATRGKPVFRVDSRESLVVIEVRRGGSLARLGHDHVVASHEVGGYVAPDEGRADLYVQLERLEVDEAALRAEAGFDSQPTESDIEGSRDERCDHAARRHARAAGAGDNRRRCRRDQRDRAALARSDRFRHHALLGAGRRHRGAKRRRSALPHPRA